MALAALLFPWSDPVEALRGAKGKVTSSLTEIKTFAGDKPVSPAPARSGCELHPAPPFLEVKAVSLPWGGARHIDLAALPSCSVPP